MSNKPITIGQCRCGGNIIETPTQWRCSGCSLVLRRDNELNFTREAAIETFTTGKTPWMQVELPEMPGYTPLVRFVCKWDRSVYLERADAIGQLLPVQGFWYAA
jgi:hypothetical protein